MWRCRVGKIRDFRATSGVVGVVVFVGLKDLKKKPTKGGKIPHT